MHAAVGALPTRPLSWERRVDWPRLIADLQRAGMSHQEVAEALAVAKSTLRGYAGEVATAEPPYWLGHRLIQLWREALCVQTGRPPHDVNGLPLRVAPLSVAQVLRGQR